MWGSVACNLSNIFVVLAKIKEYTREGGAASSNEFQIEFCIIKLETHGVPDGVWQKFNYGVRSEDFKCTCLFIFGKLFVLGCYAFKMKWNMLDIVRVWASGFDFELWLGNAKIPFGKLDKIRYNRSPNRKIPYRSHLL